MKPLSVLIVDDNIAARKLLRAVLAGTGQRFVIYEAASGIEAFNNFRLNYYDIVFLDIEMPDMSGFEILEKIRSEYPSQFVIIVSANATVVNVKKTIELGGQGFIAKPYTTKKVKSVVDRYIKKIGIIPLL